MEDGGRQARIDFRNLPEQIHEVLNRTGAAGSNHRNIDCVFHRPEHFQVEALLHSIGVNAVYHDLPGAVIHTPADPIDGVHAGVVPAAPGEHREPAVRPGHIHRQNHALVPVDIRRLFNQVRIPDRTGVDRNLVRPALQHPVKILNRVDAAAHRKRNEDGGGHFLQDVREQLPSLSGCGDVIEHQLICAVVTVILPQFHRGGHIGQSLEVHTFHHPSVFHVQAGDNSFRNHCFLSILRRFQ